MEAEVSRFQNAGLDFQLIHQQRYKTSARSWAKAVWCWAGRQIPISRQRNTQLKNQPVEITASLQQRFRTHVQTLRIKRKALHVTGSAIRTCAIIKVLLAWKHVPHV